MTMTLPTLPELPAGYIVTDDDLNDLAYACTFILTKPICRVVDSAGSQSIGTSFTLMSWGTDSIDTDGMWSSSAKTQLTIQTAGWYKIRYNIVADGGTSPYNTVAHITTGSNNPSGSGNVSANFWAGYCNPLSASPGGGAGASGVIPFYLYEGDYVQVYAEASATGLSTIANLSELSLEFVSLY